MNTSHILLVLLLVQFPCLADVYGVHTIRDSVLTGHVYNSTHSLSWIDCIEMCSAQTKCVSYNYQYEGMDQGLCELNNCGFADQCNAESKLLFSPKQLFQQVRQPTEKKYICGPWNKVDNRSPGVEEEVFNVNVTSCPRSQRSRPHHSNESKGFQSRSHARLARTAKVCQNPRRDDKLKITCAGHQVLHIQSANYGRPSGCSCECGVCQNLHSDCSSYEASSVIQRKCRDKKQCVLQARNSWFGNPCKGFKKQLIVMYSCF